MTTLWLDTETYSETPITHGTYRYAENAEVMLVAYAFDDEPVEVLDLTAGGSLGNVQMMIDSADRVVVHNSNFDRTVLRCNGIHIPLEKLHDTMAQALAHSLPGSLGALCDVLGVPQDKAKDKAGKKLVHLFTKPRPRNVKLRRATRETHPEEWAAFIDYARLDVDAMRDVSRRLPGWNNSGGERRVWLLDQHINDRGIAVDVGLAEAALRAFQRSARSLAERAGLLTNGAVPSLTQGARFTAYLASIGYDTPDLTKGTVAAALKGDLPDHVRELLEIRQQASATSPAKYKVLINGASSDGRLRGLLQYCGASRTGRWGGRLFQPQNLPRPTLKQDLIDTGIAAMKADCEDLLFDNVSELCASAVRGALVAAPGCKLVIADLSNIEGRVLAWLAGEQWKVAAFKEFDAGVGHDLYKLAYARSFNKQPEDVSKDERQIGKVMELACIAESEPVLTDSGLKPIQEVTLRDRVWDGEDFVAHDGVIFKGVKKVISYDGLTATEDHLVFVEGQQEPVPFGHAAASGARLVQSGAGGSPVRVGGGAFSRKALRPEMAITVCANSLHRLRMGAMVLLDQFDAGKVRWLSDLFPTQACAEMAGAALLSGATTLREHEEPAVSGVRGAGHNVWLFRPHSNGRVGRRESWASEGQGTRPDQQRQGVRAGEPSLGVEGGQYPERETREVAVYDILNAGPRNRYTASGRLVHNCGYQGGLGAFNTMAKAYGLSLPDAEVTANVAAWRKAHPAVKAFWYDLEAACKSAISNPGERHKVQLLSIAFKDTWLRIRLPSGRQLGYPNAAIEDGRLVYDGVNQFTKKWERIETYGGKITENIVQAVARDVLASGLLRAEAAGYAVCLHVHDEIIAEVPDTDEYSAEGLSKIMATNPGWSLGLPLAAAGFETHRYRKD